MAAKAAMAHGTHVNWVCSAEAMGFIFAALFFNTLTRPSGKNDAKADGWL